MDTQLLRASARKAIPSCRLAIRPGSIQQQKRCMATPTNAQEPVRAAAPISFTSDRNQFSKNSGSREGQSSGLLSRVRVVPASPSYFTATPQYTDDLLHLTSLLRRFQHLPLCPPGKAPLIAWKTFEQYVAEVNEPIKITRFARMLGLIKRLNYIHTPLMPLEVAQSLSKFKRTLQPLMNQKRPIKIDDWGRARAVGKRKSSSAQCWVVEGEGEVLINGKSLSEYFGRIHDRESAIWALKATARVDKYNVFVIVKGGGTTGQAEAITLGVARALLAHEPALRPALRRAGCLTRDPRRVERKKPGKLKARKMPAWVKR